MSYSRSRLDSRLCLRVPAVLLSACVQVLGAPLASASRRMGAPDAVVVLGAPLLPDSRLSAVLEERLQAGVEAWHQTGAPIFCVTGGFSAGGRHRRPEAEAMAERALQLGIPASALRVERCATNTVESAYRCAAQLEMEGVRRVIVVTQPFHLRRAVHCFRRAGLETQGWMIQSGIQQREPALSLRWIAGEYASWAKQLGLELGQRAGGCHPADRRNP